MLKKDFFYFSQPKSILPNDIHYIPQGYSLHSLKSSRGVGVEIVKRDNIL
jgi:hypothetical protein